MPYHDTWYVTYQRGGGRIIRIKRRTRWPSTVSIQLTDELRRLSFYTSIQMSDLIDEAMQDLIQKYIENGRYRPMKEEDPVYQNHTTFLCCAANKGGVGKTFTISSFGHLLGRQKRVLLIDSDPQGNLSKKFGYIPDENRGNKKQLGDAIKEILESPIGGWTNAGAFTLPTPYPNIDIIICTDTISTTRLMVNDAMIQQRNPYKELFTAIDALKKYDIVLIDTRPSIEHDMVPIILAATKFFIPLTPDRDGIDGANDTLKFITQMKGKSMPSADFFVGFYFNKVNANTLLAHQLIPQFRDLYPGFVLQSVTTIGEDVNKAQTDLMPVTDKYPASRVSKDIAKVLKEVVERIGKE